MTVHKWWLLGLCLTVVPACSKKAPAPTKAELVARGDAAMAKQDFAAAFRDYTAAAADPQSPPDGSVLLKAANAAVSGRQARPALRAAEKAAAAMPDDLGAQLLYGRLLLSSHNYPEALEKMRDFDEKHPNDLGVLIAMGNAIAHLDSTIVALASLGAARDKDELDGMAFKLRGGVRGPTAAEDAEAEKTFRRAIAVDPASPRTQMALANFLWATGRFAEAEPVLKGVADAHPEQGLANLSLGKYWVLVHRDQDAEPYLKAAAEGTSGAEEDAARELADLYSRTKRDAAAHALLSSMLAKHPLFTFPLAKLEFRLGKHDDAFHRLDALLAATPPDGRAQALKAELLVATGRLDQALPLARAGAAGLPNVVDTRATLGRVLLLSGDLESAVDEFAEAMKLNPRSSESAMSLSRALLTLGRTKDALQSARDAVRLRPAGKDEVLLLVQILVDTADPLGAEIELKPLITREPGAADVLVQVGRVSMARDKDDAARAAFTKAQQVAPDSADAISGLALLDLKQKHADAARQRLEAALVAHPNDPVVLKTALQVEESAKDAPRIESMRRRLIAVDHTHPTAAVDLATSLTREHPDDARRVLEDLLARRPRAVPARYALATLLRASGKTEEARKHYEKILAEPARPDTVGIVARASAALNALPARSGQ